MYTTCIISFTNKDLNLCHDFQKFGFCCNLRTKFSYHCDSLLNGINVSLGLGVIWDWVTANDPVKFNKFSHIFLENSKKGCWVDKFEAEAGVCWASCESSSTEIPIWAMWDWGSIWPNGWLPLSGIYNTLFFTCSQNKACSYIKLLTWKNKISCHWYLSFKQRNNCNNRRLFFGNKNMSLKPLYMQSYFKILPPIKEIHSRQESMTAKRTDRQTTWVRRVLMGWPLYASIVKFCIGKILVWEFLYRSRLVSASSRLQLRWAKNLKRNFCYINISNQTAGNICTFRLCYIKITYNSFLMVWTPPMKHALKTNETLNGIKWNSMLPDTADLRFVILNIALGLALVKCPSRTQDCPDGLGQEKYTENRQKRHDITRPKYMQFIVSM